MFSAETSATTTAIGTQQCSVATESLPSALPVSSHWFCPMLPLDRCLAQYAVVRDAFLAFLVILLNPAAIADSITSRVPVRSTQWMYDT